MGDTKIQNVGFGDAALAERVISEYADGIDGLTKEECADIKIDTAHCTTLQEVLDKGKDVIVTDDERAALGRAGFAKEFIDGIAGSDGKRALHERVKWLGDHAVTKWYRMDLNERGRGNVIDELGDVGPDAAPAVPALIEALRDDSWSVREGAAKVLGKIGAAAAPAVPALIEALKDSDSAVRQAAARALGEIGPAAKDAVPALIKALEDVDVRWNAAEALGKIGAPAAPAVPALIEALQDKDSDVRQAAAFALGRIGPATILAVHALIEALMDENRYVREDAANALGKIGPAAKHAVPELKRMRYGDPDPNCRKAAGEAIEKIAGE